MANGSRVLRVDRLEVQGFRAFEHFAIDLDPECTVLVGKNGAGKTSVYAALAHALGSLLRGLGTDGLAAPREAHETLVRHASGGVSRDVADVVEARARGWLLGEATSWAAQRRRGRLTPEPQGRRLTDALRDASTVLPIIAAYPTDRAFPGGDGDDADRDLPKREDGYASSLDAPLALDRMATFYRREAFAEVQRGGRSPILAAVEHVVTSGVPGVEAIRYDIGLETIVVRIGGRDALFGHTSDGFRTMIGLLFDLAWRALVLNPQLAPEDIRDVGGVVAIDEVDLHLHPAWQRRIVQDLRRTFPRIQWLMTTHSPQVVGACEPHQVRILQADGGVRTPKHTFGKDTNALLSEVFGTEERADGALDGIARLESAIASGDGAQARGLLRELRVMLGDQDRTLIGFEYEVRDLEVHGAADK